MFKKFRFAGVLLCCLMLVTLLLSACGDTATSAPASTTAASVATTTSAATSTSAATTTTSAAGTTAAAASGGGNGQTIRIYSSLPDTGSSKTQIDTMVAAMKLALDQVTGGTGAVGGFKIDYVPLDDATAAAGQWDAGQEAANANKAVNDPDAMIYIGTFNSGAAKVSIPILNKGGLAMISPGNTYPGLTKAVQGVTDTGEPDKYYPTGVRNYFRVVTDDDLQGPADAQFIAQTLKAKKLYIIDDSQSYGVGLAKSVELEAPKNGLTVLAHDSITGKETGYSSLANKIKSAAPDAIFFGGISQQQAGKLLSDIRAAGVQIPWVSGDGTNDDAFLKDAGSAGEGAYSSVTGVAREALGPQGQAFLKAYIGKYGDNIQAYTIKGYDAMGVALDAIKRAGKKDRKAILDAVAATKDYDGAQGKFSFDKNGDTTLTTFSFYVDKAGQWVYSSSIDPAAK